MEVCAVYVLRVPRGRRSLHFSKTLISWWLQVSGQCLPLGGESVGCKAAWCLTDRSPRLALLRQHGSGHAGAHAAHLDDADHVLP